MTISLHMSVCLMQPWQVKHCIAQTEWAIYYPIKNAKIKNAKKGTYMVFFQKRKDLVEA